MIIHVYALMLIAIISFILFIVTNQKKGIYSSPFFTYAFLATSIITMGFLYEASSPSIAWGFLCTIMKYFGIQYLPILAFLTILDYLDRRPPIFAIILMFFPAVAMTFLVATWPLNGICFEDISLYTGTHFAQLKFQPGIVYIIIMAYLYLIYAAMLFFSILYGFKDPSKRKIIIILNLATGVVFLYSIIYYFGLTPEGLDYLPYFLLISILFLGYSIFRLDAFDILPQAKEIFLEHMDDLLIVLDEKMRFKYANKAVKQLFQALSNSTNDIPLNKLLAAINESSSSPESREIEIIDDDNNILHFTLTRKPVLKKTRTVGYCIILHNITDEKSTIQMLQNKATHDGLTQIYNHAAFKEQATELLNAAERERADSCLLLIDIDYFKAINDTYGHACGDMVLQSLTDNLKSLLRGNDLFGRLGGEEFGILITGISAVSAFQLAEKLRTAVSESEIRYNGGFIKVTISIGLAHSSRGPSYEELFLHADSALYQAKGNGRNLSVLWGLPIQIPL